MLWACAAGGPPAPYNVTATSDGVGVDLRWDAGGTPSRFLVERSEGVNYNFVAFAWIKGNERYFRDDAVAAGEWYYYRLAGWFERWEGKTGRMSEYSPEVGVEVK